MSGIPYPDAAALAESGFRKISLARQQRRAGDVDLAQSADETEDAGLAELSKAYLLARARVQRANEGGPIDGDACPGWLGDFGHRLAAKYNACEEGRPTTMDAPCWTCRGRLDEAHWRAPPAMILQHPDAGEDYEEVD